MLALRRLVLLRGYPSKLFSDRNTQLTAAGIELKSLLQVLDWETIKNFDAEKSIEWNFTPADAPW